MRGHDLPGALDAFLSGHTDELIAFRRDLHAHPELGYHEHRTTRIIAARLAAAGLRAAVLPKGTGLLADIDGANGRAGGPVVALRADLDALPVPDEKNVPYRSTVRNACHACGHDVHTAILVGTGLFLARLAAAGELRGRVRLVFQPAEEIPGGRSACALGRLPQPATKSSSVWLGRVGIPHGRTSPQTSYMRWEKSSPSCRRRYPGG